MIIIENIKTTLTEWVIMEISYWYWFHCTRGKRIYIFWFVVNWLFILQL